MFEIILWLSYGHFFKQTFCFDNSPSAALKVIIIMIMFFSRQVKIRFPLHANPTMDKNISSVWYHYVLQFYQA